MGAWLSSVRNVPDSPTHSFSPTVFPSCWPAVGYFNYRYFVNFLIFACVSMLYGASLTYAPFILLSTTKYREQYRANKHHFKVSDDPNSLPRMEPFLPYANEKMYITLTFMLSLAVGLAVAMLTFFHIYLTLTSQTTIEFHGKFLFVLCDSIRLPPLRKART